MSDRWRIARASSSASLAPGKHSTGYVTVSSGDARRTAARSSRTARGRRIRRTPARRTAATWCSHRAKNGIGPSTTCASSQLVPAVTLGREGRQQLRVAVVAVGRVEQRPDEPARGLGRARRRQLHPERVEDLGGVPLEAGQSSSLRSRFGTTKAPFASGADPFGAGVRRSRAASVMVVRAPVGSCGRGQTTRQHRNGRQDQG